MNIGETYVMRGYPSQTRTIVGIMPDGRLIVTSGTDHLTFRRSDGSSLTNEPKTDLVKPPKVVKATRQIVTNDCDGVNIKYGKENVEFTFTGGKLTGVRLL